ncbi:MAG: prephenate dehydratase [Candidatus Coproplasma sp.]
METIGYLGPDGSYSQLAAQKLCNGANLKEYPTFYALMEALLCGGADGIILPIENSINGGVMQNIDLLEETEGVLAVAETTVKIDHRLATLKGADKSKITSIYSHVQALGQCAKYLTANFPDARRVPTDSTSGSLKMIKTERDAGIVGSHCAADGYELSPHCISDEPANFTQFLLVKKRTLTEIGHSGKIYFSITCRHEPGALVSLLSVLCAHSLNMTKIESRPIKDKPGEYRFFIEMEADYASPDVKSALKEIKDKSQSVKLLGCY